MPASATCPVAPAPLSRGRRRELAHEPDCGQQPVEVHVNLLDGDSHSRQAPRSQRFVVTNKSVVTPTLMRGATSRYSCLLVRNRRLPDLRQPPQPGQRRRPWPPRSCDPRPTRPRHPPTLTLEPLSAERLWSASGYPRARRGTPLHAGRGCGGVITTHSRGREKISPTRPPWLTGHAACHSRDGCTQVRLPRIGGLRPR